MLIVTELGALGRDRDDDRTGRFAFLEALRGFDQAVEQGVLLTAEAGIDAIRPVKPDTIAKSLAIGNPADGIYVLDICRETGGAVEDIDDEQVRDAIVLLARTEGVFTETAGGTTVGVLKKLVETGQLDTSLETVVINTGHGLKTLDSISDRVGAAATIEPSYAAFTASGIEPR